MSELETRGDQSPPAEEARKTCPTGACPLQSRWGLVLVVALIGLIGFMQWPMIKGVYYKTANPPAPASAVAWRTGFDEALAESARTGKPVLVDFTASWCPPCVVMKHEVWPDEVVAEAANGGYVPLLVDIDDPRNAEVVRRYGIEAIPAVLVLDAEGRVIRTGAFMSKSDMLAFLERRT